MCKGDGRNIMQRKKVWRFPAHLVPNNKYNFGVFSTFLLPTLLDVFYAALHRCFKRPLGVMHIALGQDWIVPVYCNSQTIFISKSRNFYICTSHDI